MFYIVRRTPVAAPRKKSNSTALSVTLASDAINLQFNVSLPTPNWWWLLIPLVSIVLCWRPELTEYIKILNALLK
jgi:hypothetical protein